MTRTIDLPVESRPFVAALVAADEDFSVEHAAYAAQFSPELVGEVHESFVAYLLCCTMSDPGAKRIGAEYLAVVERAGLLDAAWHAVGYLRAARIVGTAIRKAQRATPPTMH
jgi:hypothetical protein